MHLNKQNLKLILYNKIFNKEDKNEWYLKRLKNIEDKNEKQLRAIEDQGDKKTCHKVSD